MRQWTVYLVKIRLMSGADLEVVFRIRRSVFGDEHLEAVGGFIRFVVRVSLAIRYIVTLFVVVVCCGLSACHLLKGKGLVAG